jgi:hypothetical protein
LISIESAIAFEEKLMRTAAIRVIIRLLASTLVLAIPTAIYFFELRRVPEHRFSSTLLLVGLAAQCLEIEAFLWLALVPGLNWLVARSLGPGRAQVHLEALSAVEDSGGVPLWAGPCFAVLIPISGFALGYRVYGVTILGLAGPFLGSVVFFLATLPVALYYTITAVIKRDRTRGRAIAALAILVLAIPCEIWFEPAFNVGRTRLESRIGLCRLGKECLSIFELHANAAEYGWAEVPNQTGSAIARLRPTYINARRDQLRIELHGGFEHFGYELRKDQVNGGWELWWYSVSWRGDQELLTWPIGRDPCEGGEVMRP